MKLEWSVWAWVNEDGVVIYAGKQAAGNLVMHRKKYENRVERPPRDQRIIVKEFASEKACIDFLERFVHESKMKSLEMYGKDINKNSDWTNYKSLFREHKTLGVTNSRGKTVYAYKDGELVGRFDSITQCARQLGVNKGNLISVMRGRLKSTAGYVFSEVELNKDK